ncbi:MAG: DoxX family protein [Patescibacteria group bacterium]
MNNDKKASVFILLGRVALSALFIIFGFLKIGTFAGMVAFATSAGVPFPELAITLAIVIELLAGLMVLVGYQTKWAALAIALFLIPVTYYFHRNFADQVNLTMFWKNISILGGMLVLAAHGAGRYSIDGYLAKKSS